VAIRLYTIFLVIDFSHVVIFLLHLDGTKLAYSLALYSFTFDDLYDFSNFLILIRLYEALVFSLLLYRSELWLLSVIQLKKLEAAHHRWQQSILGVS